MIQQVLRTATITSPPALWLLRPTLGAMAEVGITRRVLAGIILAPVATGIAVVGVYFMWPYGLDAVEEHAKPMSKGCRGLS